MGSKLEIRTEQKLDVTIKQYTFVLWSLCSLSSIHGGLPWSLGAHIWIVFKLSAFFSDIKITTND